MIRLFFLIILTFFSVFLQGQNLVRNPSFEKRGFFFFSFLRPLKDLKKWTAPGRGSSDYFSYGIGKLNAHSGQCFVAIGTFYDGPLNQEYLQSKLLKKLTANQEYCITIFVRRSNDKDLSYALNQLEVALTAHKLRSHNKKIIKVADYIVMSNGKELTETQKWIQIKSTFIAKGNENFITIGKFDENLKLIPILNKKGKQQGKFKSAYYYIDDICLTEVINPNKKCNCYENESYPKDTFILPPNPYKTDKSIILRTINFKIDDSYLEEGSFEELNKLAGTLNSHLSTYIQISGHTDSSGNEIHNIELSEKRAKSVADYLISKGVDADRIQFKGFGSSSPLVTNTSEENRKVNRRVEIKIVTR